jgi:glucokinase
MKAEPLLMGIDLGGTNVRIGLVQGQTILNLVAQPIPAQGSEQQILDDIFSLIDTCIHKQVTAIGFGAPSVVDVEQGIVYDTVNIPSWKRVELKAVMEARYGIPVYVNNDANCFALGERYYGQGRDCRDMVGLIVGTGLGAGLILNNRLYAGRNCGAGEFGMMSYLDQYLEYYCCGQFFKNVHQTSGEAVFAAATQGDSKALAMFEEFGCHFAHAIKNIMYAIDPQKIILGGSVSKAFSLFEKPMWEAMQDFCYKQALATVNIVASTLEHVGVLGAAALWQDQQQT